MSLSSRLLALSLAAALLLPLAPDRADAAIAPGRKAPAQETTSPRPGPGESLEPGQVARHHLVQLRHIERFGRDGMPDIFVVYPSIGHDDVDRDIRLWMEHIVASFEADLSRPAPEVGHGAPAGGWMPPDPSLFSLSSTCRVTFPSSNAVSVTFELWMYTGAEHPSEDMITLNYSLITGQRLALVDMFEDVDTALSLLSGLCREELSRRVGQGRVNRQIAYGTEPLPENFASIELTPRGVRVLFQPYQVAGWEAGAQVVDIALEKLAAARPLPDLWGRRTLAPAAGPSASGKETAPSAGAGSSARENGAVASPSSGTDSTGEDLPRRATPAAADPGRLPAAPAVPPATGLPAAAPARPLPARLLS